MPGDLFSMVKKVRIESDTVFLNFSGAQGSIPRNRFRQPYVAWRAGTTTLFLLGS
jgi:hypothetical protein